MNNEFLKKYESVITRNFNEGFGAITDELTTLNHNLENEIEDLGIRERLFDLVEIISIAAMRARIYDLHELSSDIIKKLMVLNTRINRMNLKYENIEFLQLLNMKVFVLLNSLIMFR